MKIFDEIESEVQSYARSFPRVFNKAKMEHLYDNDGNMYLDFLAGAGTLNYGHNNPLFKEDLLKYIMEDGITHGLDMHTKAKGEFLEAFNEKILKPTLRRVYTELERTKVYWLNWNRLVQPVFYHVARSRTLVELDAYLGRNQ